MPRGLVRAALLSLGLAHAAAAATIQSASGVRVEVGQDGAYAVSGPAGSVGPFGGRVGAPATAISEGRGVDAIGAYRDIRFKWGAGLAGEIRAYDERAAAEFIETTDRAQDGWTEPLPRFTRIPGGLHRFSYASKVFAPPVFRTAAGGTPWLWFDDAGRSAILSPAANFMTADMAGDGVTLAACGLNPEVAHVPAGFSHRALLVFAPGINCGWDRWGDAMRRLVGRSAPANDSDVGLRYLGYWTDNGAYYYYNYDRSLGYQGTLEALLRHFKAAAVPVRYLQLDSWWYEKTLTGPDGREGRTKNPALPRGAWNRYGGLLQYVADPAVFPDGLAGFERAVRLPLIVHNRWIDRASPYRKDFKIAGYAAVDPRWWDEIMSYIARAGVQTYEQDWLNVIYLDSPALAAVPGVGEQFLDDMAHSAGARHLTLQYCMPLPRHFLQGSHYDTLSTIRTSDDRFGRKRWDSFLYTSRLASALGIWPWSDVFMSTETDNLLLANLSGGMVGFGDRMGAENLGNLLRACRPDGVLVKPDHSIVPTDETYIAEARGERAPMVAWTCTDAPRTAYVFAYARRAGEAEQGRFTPSEMGFSGEVEVLDTRSGAAWRQRAGQPVAVLVQAASPAPSGAGTLRIRDTGYFEIAQVDPEGMALFGDEGKFASNGAGRIAVYREEGKAVHLAVLFALNEKPARLLGYAPRQPSVTASEGTVGKVLWDAATGKFEFYVGAGSRAFWGSPSENSEPDQTQVAQIDITP